MIVVFVLVTFLLLVVVAALVPEPQKPKHPLRDSSEERLAKLREDMRDHP